MSGYKKADAIGPDGMAVLTKVRMLRRKRGLSLRALAEETTRTGRPVSVDALNKIELGVRRIDVDDLFAIARAFNISPAVLLEPPEGCTVCEGEPPTGFQCRSCGAES